MVSIVKKSNAAGHVHKERMGNQRERPEVDLVEMLLCKIPEAVIVIL